MNNSSPSLRILQLNSMLTGGGTDDQCVKLASELKRLGQQVWVAGPAGREWSGRVTGAGVPLVDTGAEGPLKFAFMARAARFVRREKIQIVHGHHGRDIWPTILVARLSGVKPKIVLTRHLAKSPSSWFSRRFLLQQCDALIAVSEFVAKVLREGVYEPDSPEKERRSRPPIFGDFQKVHVLFGGIDTEKFQPGESVEQRKMWGLQPDDFAFAVVGGYSLPRGKGQREFLVAASRVHERIPRAKFLVIGRGNMKEILESDIARLGLAGKAWLTPYCQDMPTAMNAIDCLVHPQIGTEALGLVVCEAHACGKPVIASALDGVPEAFRVGDYGQLVQPESVDDLAGAMLKWCGEPGLSLEQTKQLHARVRRQFSLPVSANKVLGLYRQLTADSGN